MALNLRSEDEIWFLALERGVLKINVVEVLKLAVCLFFCGTFFFPGCIAVIIAVQEGLLSPQPTPGWQWASILCGAFSLASLGVLLGVRKRL